MTDAEVNEIGSLKKGNNRFFSLGYHAERRQEVNNVIIKAIETLVQVHRSRDNAMLLLVKKMLLSKIAGMHK